MELANPLASGIDFTIRKFKTTLLELEFSGVPTTPLRSNLKVSQYVVFTFKSDEGDGDEADEDEEGEDEDDDDEDDDDEDDDDDGSEDDDDEEGDIDESSYDSNLLYVADRLECFESQTSTLFSLWGCLVLCGGASEIVPGNHKSSICFGARCIFTVACLQFFVH